MSDSTHKPTAPFLQRWSRLKQQDRETALKPESAVGEPAQSSSTASAESRELPPVETLSIGSDFTAYLAKNVTESLRRQALRKLFHLPEFNVVDGLDDYAEDFTYFAPLGDTVTHDMRRLLEREARAALEHELEDESEQARSERLAATPPDEPDVQGEINS